MIDRLQCQEYVVKEYYYMNMNSHNVNVKTCKYYHNQWSNRILKYFFLKPVSLCFQHKTTLQSGRCNINSDHYQINWFGRSLSINFLCLIFN